MKRAAISLASLFGMATVVVLGVAWARPDLIPSRLRPGGPAPPPSPSGLYCKEHGVPEAFCTLCHEELKDKLMLCKEHGNIPEDICTLCHPEVQKTHAIEMCPKGHGLPRHFCEKCGTNPSASLDEPDDGWCGEHNRPEELCLECAKDGGGRAKPGDLTGSSKACRRPWPVVRLASAKLSRRVGIETALASMERHTHRIACTAEVAYDGNRYAEARPRVASLVREVRADLGQHVRRGDVLAVVDASEVGSAKSSYLTHLSDVELATINADRARSLAKQKIIGPTKEVEAVAALNRARAGLQDTEQHLRNLGLSEADLSRVAGERDAKGTLSVVAPIDGEVVMRRAVVGEAVDATGVIFAVADTSRMWLWFDVSQGDLARVKPGLRVSFSIPGSGIAEHAGTVTWVNSGINPRTRTARMRAELPNPDGFLRDHQFGRAEVQLGDEHDAVLVPDAAVQSKDGVDVVFLPQRDASFRPQRVTTRRTGTGDAVEVTWGLKRGQRVVTTGAFLLKTEIMKGSIGAGCCD
jgi:cobalt-zinc-cadmium efflux system membrane fusion protein